MVCRRAHFDAPGFARWNPGHNADSAPSVLRPPDVLRPLNAVVFHCKSWEWAAITQALDERGMLRAGRRGGGFAVGREPLTSRFAAMGAEILATDLGDMTASADWSATGQHAAGLEALYWPKLIDREAFEARVRFLPQDMRALDAAALGVFDFVWSSCSFEHLGNLEAGLRFVLDSMALLRPGGVAVHTTEFNLSSDDATVEAGTSVIYRRRDLAALAGGCVRSAAAWSRWTTSPARIPRIWSSTCRHITSMAGSTSNCGSMATSPPR
jgi:SAM-dependent methyltransferase